MNVKDKIKFFMGAKAKRLWLMGVKNWYLYYEPKDAEEIDQWDNDKANEIWWQIKKEIFVHCSSGLTAATCPWCQGFGCFECRYKKRHFPCCVSYSDFTRILAGLRKQTPFIDEFLDKIYFSNKWYKRLIIEIESKKR